MCKRIYVFIRKYLLFSTWSVLMRQGLICICTVSLNKMNRFLTLSHCAYLSKKRELVVSKFRLHSRTTHKSSKSNTDLCLPIVLKYNSTIGKATLIKSLNIVNKKMWVLWDLDLQSLSSTSEQLKWTLNVLFLST